MPFFPRAQQEIVNNGLRKLRDHAGITQSSPGSKARFFLETMAQEQAIQNNIFDTNLPQAYIQSCSGQFLDFFGDLLGEPRLIGTHAESGTDNFIWYVNGGTFGSINNGNGISIPAGVTVMTEAPDVELVTTGIVGLENVTYITAAPTFCPPGSSFITTPLRASIEGKAGNVPPGVLTGHSFTDYTQVSSGTLRCTNRFSIDSGAERETDGSYRYRLLQVFKSREKATKAAIRLAALSVPGVSDIIMLNCEQGPGTCTVYIQSSTPTVSNELVGRVSFATELVTSEGIRLYISPSNPLGLEFVLAVNWRSSVTEEEKVIEYQDIREAVGRTLNTIKMGEPVIIEDLLVMALRAAPSALSIGRAKPNSFEEVYVYRSSPTRQGYIRSRLYADIVTPLYNERIILEAANAYNGIQFI